MPIKGLTDERRTLPRLGKIRTGIKKKSSKGKEYPEETPYFVLDPNEPVLDKVGNVIGQRNNEYIQKLIEVFGDRPHEIEIAFPLDSLDACASHYYKWWGGNVEKKKSLLMCMGDGEYASYQGQQPVPGLNDPSIPRNHYVVGEGSRGKIANRICNFDQCPQALSGQCKPNMNLRVIIPKVSMFGTFQIDTTSIQAMDSILGSLSLARGALRMKGIQSIAGVPLILYRERTPNKHNNVNYIMKVRVSESRLEEEIKLLSQNDSNSLLMLGGTKQVALDTINHEEFNVDLVPQSLHGQPQTGDSLDYIEHQASAPKVDDVTDWVRDDEVVYKFEQLGNLVGQRPTEAKMIVRARKCKSKEDLVQYLDQQIIAHQKKQAEASQPSRG